jgi:hypothetical protein
LTGNPNYPVTDRTLQPAWAKSGGERAAVQTLRDGNTSGERIGVWIAVALAPLSPTPDLTVCPLDNPEIFLDKGGIGK